MYMAVPPPSLLQVPITRVLVDWLLAKAINNHKNLNLTYTLKTNVLEIRHFLLVFNTSPCPERDNSTFVNFNTFTLLVILTQ